MSTAAACSRRPAGVPSVQVPLLPWHTTRDDKAAIRGLGTPTVSNLGELCRPGNNRRITISWCVSLPSKTKLDQLGERLRQRAVTDDDFRLLDAFRRSFAAGYEEVLDAIRSNLGSEPTGRPAKSTSSIIEKLQRETIRLTQIQDIAGCRLVVPHSSAQEQTVTQLRGALDEVTVVDRRTHSSHGYRAVHLVVIADGKPIEIQVRTTLQHLWAEFSEKMADVVDPAVKYGGGPEPVKKLLAGYSDLVKQMEKLELMPAGADQQQLKGLRQEIRQLLETAIIEVSKTRSRK